MAAELVEIRELERQQSLTPKLLVRKGMLLQMDDDPRGELSEVEESFRKALDIDPDYVEAYIELGYYYYAVLDNAASGRDFFLKAADLLRKLNSEVLEGLVECAEELEPERDSAAVREQYAAMLVSGQESRNRS